MAPPTALMPAVGAVDVMPGRTLRLVEEDRTAPMRQAVPPLEPGIVPRRALFERLEGASRVIEVSGPAGSGKTVLLRSWIRQAGLADDTAWVSVPSAESDGQQFWLSVLDALRGTAAGSVLVSEFTPAPGVDTGEIVMRLLEDLDRLRHRTLLVIDDLHELRSGGALAQLEMLMTHAPAALRIALVTRHDLRLGLHRLRVEGGLTEIRAGDLSFTADEARELFDAAGVQLSGSALRLLHERTEGWAAGLRLAALSLAGHPDPERFATEFSGSERTVADYLLAEVLERQPEQVRRLLLRTSVLGRVSGPLADRLTGDCGGERILRRLEESGAFVASLDASRSWFRYHNLFSDLLALELRRTAPGESRKLHRAAAGWFAEHGHPVEAIRHAQAAEDWSLAATLLADHWFRLVLDGHAATAHELLCGFPDPVASDAPELIALAAADELNRGSFEEAERHLARATREWTSMPVARRGRLQVMLGILRLCLARQRSDVATVAEEARQLLAPADAPAAADLGMRPELRALALISLGIAETSSGQHGAADRHLEQGVGMARRLEEPFLELLGLAHGARLAVGRSYVLGIRRCRQAIELAGRHGWNDEPLAGVASASLAEALVAQGQLDESEQWLARAGRTLRADLEPTAGMILQFTRGMFDLARDRPEQALEAFESAERLSELLLSPPGDVVMVQAQKLQTLVRLGRTETVEAILAAMDEAARDTAFTRIATAALRLSGDDPQAASDSLAPVIDGSVPARHPIWLVQALLLEAIARDMLRDAGAAERAIERALDLAEPDRILSPFLIHPVRGLLERHARHRTGHGALISEILNLLARGGSVSAFGEPQRLREALSASEMRVLRFLPTNLSLRDIGHELYVSVHTVKTHIRHLYGKLDVHSRGDAVERARLLGLLAPSVSAR